MRKIRCMGTGQNSRTFIVDLWINRRKTNVILFQLRVTALNEAVRVWSFKNRPTRAIGMEFSTCLMIS